MLRAAADSSSTGRDKRYGPLSPHWTVSRACAVFLLAASPAFAAPLPASWIERPLTLSRMMLQVSIEGELTNSLNDTYDQYLQGGALGLSAELGLTAHLQIGAFFVIPVSPFVDFGSLIGNAQLNVVDRILNVRVDIGATRTVQAYAGSYFHGDSLVVGVGLPLRLSLSRIFAVVSGSTEARTVGAPFMNVLFQSFDAVWGGMLETSSDLFTVWKPTNGPLLAMSAYAPVGILVQPLSFFAVSGGSGYRFGVALTLTPGAASARS
jgi:hypothetical protein